MHGAGNARLGCEALEARQVLSTSPLVAPLATTNAAEVAGLALEADMPAVAADAAGNYVVAWIGNRPDAESGETGDRTQTILAQRYNAAGEATGPLIEVRKTSGPVEQLDNVRVAMADDGRFVIAWNYQSSVHVGTSGVPYLVQAQRFDASGATQGGVVWVPAGHSRLQDLAISPTGAFLIAYRAEYPSFLGPYRKPELFVQRFDADGNRQGDAISLGQPSGNSYWDNEVRTAMAADGSFVIVSRDVAPHGQGLIGQLYLADGSRLGEPFRVSWLPGEATSPAIGMDAAGNFVIAWDQKVGGEHRIYAERRDATAKALGPIIEVSEVSAAPLRPSVSMAAGGNFYVTWGELSLPENRPTPPDDLFPMIPPRAIIKPEHELPTLVLLTDLNLPAYGAAGAARHVRARAYEASGVALGEAFSIGSVDSIRGFGGSAIGPSGELIVTYLDDYPEPLDWSKTIGGFPQLFGNLSRHVYVERFAGDTRPVVDLNGPDGGVDYAANFEPGATPASIVDPTLTVRDLQASEILSARVEIVGALPGDVLAAATQNGGIFTSYADGVLTLTGTKSLGHYADVLRTVTFDSTAARPIGSRVEVRFTVFDGVAESALAVSTLSVYEPGAASIVGRHIFYNNSAFDGNDPTAGPSDDGAIAPDKQALLPGETASFANVSSYVRGINGIMIDLAGTHGVVSADDFVFHVGNRDQPAWSYAAAPTSVTVRAGAGTEGADRIEIIWPDGALTDRWLQVTVLANGNTGLTHQDTFYFGNVVGETGNSSFGYVSPSDVLRTINNLLDQQQSGSAQVAIDSAYDFNRDGRLSPADAGIVINRGLAAPPAVERLRPPGSAQGASEFYGLVIEYGISGQVYLFDESLAILVEPASTGDGSDQNLAVAAAMAAWDDDEPERADEDEPGGLLLPTEAP